jgi:hypothetical protein
MPRAADVLGRLSVRRWWRWIPKYRPEDDPLAGEEDVPDPRAVYSILCGAREALRYKLDRTREIVELRDPEQLVVEGGGGLRVFLTGGSRLRRAGPTPFGVDARWMV